MGCESNKKITRDQNFFSRFRSMLVGDECLCVWRVCAITAPTIIAHSVEFIITVCNKNPRNSLLLNIFSYFGFKPNTQTTRHGPGWRITMADISRSLIQNLHMACTFNFSPNRTYSLPLEVLSVRSKLFNNFCQCDIRNLFLRRPKMLAFNEEALFCVNFYNLH